MIVKEVIKNKEFEILSEEFFKFVNVKLDRSYLINGHSFLFSEGNTNKLLGGCSIIEKPPFRFIYLLPKSILEKNIFFKKNMINNFFEINAFFVKDKKFLRSILIEILTYIKNKINKKYMLLFFNVTNKKIFNLWKKNLHLNEIYIGKPSSDLIQTSHNLVYFGYVEKKDLDVFLKKLRHREVDHKRCPPNKQ